MECFDHSLYSLNHSATSDRENLVYDVA